MRDPLEVYPYRRLAANPAGPPERWPKSSGRRKRIFPSWVTLAVLELAFFLGRAPVLGELYPFGPALVAALGVRAPVLVWPAALAVGLGLASHPALGGLAWFSRLLTLLAIGLGFYLPAARRYWWCPPVLAAAGVASVRGLARVWGGGGLYEAVNIAFEAAFTGGLTLALLAIYPWPGRKAGEEQWLGLGLVGLGLLAGMQGFRLGGLEVAGVAGKLSLLVAALLGGSGAGASTGALVGLLPLLTGSAELLAPAGLALAGLLAGSLRGLRRPGVLGGLVLGLLILAFYQPDRGAILASLGEAGVAGGLFLLLPRGLLARFPAGSGQREPEMPALPACLEDTGAALRELAAALEMVPARAGEGNSSTRRLVEGVAGRVCRGCSLRPVCWERDFQRTWDALREMIRMLQQKQEPAEGDLPLVFQQRCSRSRELMLTVGAMVENLRREEGWQQERQEYLGLLGAQLKATAGVLARLAQDLQRQPASPRPAFRLEWAVAQRPAPGQEVSGDSVDSLSLPGRQVLLLSDGMGSGPAACRHSRAALALAGRMLAAGFDLGLLVRLLNMALLASAWQEEGFATLDLALVDLAAGQLELVKVGAAPSLLASAAGVKVIRGDSLPAGIVRQVESCRSTHSLAHGDVLVLLSDGLLGEDSAGAERRLASVLRQVADDSPRAIAGRLLEEGLRTGRRDDASVLVARVEAVRLGGIFPARAGMLGVENVTREQETAGRQRKR